MKCSKCGAPIQLNQKYCPNCGSLNEENAKHVSDMENYDSKFNKTRKQVVSNSKWFVKYMAPITAMVIAIIAIAAAIVWNQALGGYDLAHAINRKENKKNNKIIQLQLNKMLDDENYTGLYLLDRDAERTLDSSERYGWSDFYNMAYYYRDLRVSICSLYDPGQENSYYTETALSNASRAIRNAEDIINNTSKYRNRAEESVPYIDDITDKIYMFLKAYCNFTDDDITGLPEKSQTDIIMLLSRRMFDDEQKIKKSKRPLQVKLMIAVTVIAVLVIIPLTSNIMEDVFRITGRQKGYSEETLFQCFIDNEYGMLTDKIEYNKGVGRKITKEEENYYAFSDCYNAAVDYKMYIKNNEMTKAEEMLDKFRKNEEKITGRIFIDALVSIKEVYGIN